MASTRNKSMQGNYRDEKAQSARRLDNQLFNRDIDTGYAGNGLGPAKMPAEKLGYNAVDIESDLFGIGQSLEAPRPVYRPQTRQLSDIHLFTKRPVIVPNPLIIEENQRPLFN